MIVASLSARAKAAADLKFGPEEQQLAQLIQDTKDQLTTGIRQEAGIATGIRAALAAARPQMRQAYRDAGQSGASIDQMVRADLGKLSPSADAFKAASTREQGEARKRLSRGLTGALQELIARSAQAKEGQQFAVNNLQSQAARDLGKIQLRQQQLAGQRGQFTAATYQDLVDKAQAQQLAQLKFEEQQRHNQATEAISASKGSGSGRGGAAAKLSDGDRSKIAKIQDAAGRIKRGRAAGGSLAAVRAVLLNHGYSDWVVNAATDIAVYGGLSPANRTGVARQLGGYRFIPAEWPRVLTRGAAGALQQGAGGAAPRI